MKEGHPSQSLPPLLISLPVVLNYSPWWEFMNGSLHSSAVIKQERLHIPTAQIDLRAMHPQGGTLLCFWLDRFQFMVNHFRFLEPVRPGFSPSRDFLLHPSNIQCLSSKLLIIMGCINWPFHFSTKWLQEKLH
jgi:hypothetical protein